MEKIQYKPVKIRTDSMVVLSEFCKITGLSKVEAMARAISLIRKTVK